MSLFTENITLLADERSLVFHGSLNPINKVGHILKEVLMLKAAIATISATHPSMLDSNQGVGVSVPALLVRSFHR